MALDMQGWLDRYAAALGVPPITGDDVESLLSLAGVAAHASERTAAPISCYLAALSGRPIAEALAGARELADGLAGGGDPQAGA
jgi:ribosomal protein L12E/L44/L45/RPP1/RPP2